MKLQTTPNPSTNQPMKYAIYINQANIEKIRTKTTEKQEKDANLMETQEIKYLEIFKIANPY